MFALLYIMYFTVLQNILKTVKALDKEAIVHSSGPDIVLIITAVDKGTSPRSVSNNTNVVFHFQ